MNYKNQILDNRKKMKNIFYEKRGLVGRRYARVHKLSFTALTRILNGKDLLQSPIYQDESPLKMVVKQLVKDKIWVGAIPAGMILNPLDDFHKGAGVGAFSKNGDLIVSRELINHLKIKSIESYSEVQLLAVIDAFSAHDGYCNKKDEEIGREIGMNTEEVLANIKELWLKSWLKIEPDTDNNEDIRRITVMGGK